jgi:hypothetical protein
LPLLYVIVNHFTYGVGNHFSIESRCFHRSTLQLRAYFRLRVFDSASTSPSVNTAIVIIAAISSVSVIAVIVFLLCSVGV